MVTASDFLALCHELGLNQVTLDDSALTSNNQLSSIDILNLVSLIQERYDCEIDPDLLEPDNLDSCAAIAQMIEQTLRAH